MLIELICGARRVVLGAVCLIAGLSPSIAVRAQVASAPLKPSTQSYHAWQVPPPQGAAQAYFANINDGDNIETPFVAKFGLSGGWGLAPISAPISGKAGHHHLLVNRDLPLDFKQPLPFNEQYIHFGKGQMETVLNLAPGEYVLRLLLADDKHLPHFVYSKPVRVTVVKKNPVDPATLATKGLSLGVSADAGRAPVRIQFHASGFNVGHMAQKQKDTGHFRLTVTPQVKAPEAVMDFVNGQTEVWLAPPPGDYALKLELVDNASPERTFSSAATASVKVK